MSEGAVYLAILYKELHSMIRCAELDCVLDNVMEDKINWIEWTIICLFSFLSKTQETQMK